MCPRIYWHTTSLLWPRKLYYLYLSIKSQCSSKGTLPFNNEFAFVILKVMACILLGEKSVNNSSMFRLLQLGALKVLIVIILLCGSLLFVSLSMPTFACVLWRTDF